MEFKSRKPKKQLRGDILNAPSEKDWFEEDNEWRSLAEKVKQQAAEDLERNQKNGVKPPVYVEDDPEKVELNIKISVPKVDIAKQKARFKPLVAHLKRAKDKAVNATPKQRAAVIAIAVLLVATLPLYKTVTKKDDAKDVKGASTAAQDPNQDFAVAEKPLFDTVLPKGRKIDEDKITFDSKRNYAIYADQINGILINVSQQPLPEEFKVDPEGTTRERAKQFGAVEVLESGGQKMYFGETAKGIQTVILTKNNLLIFIKTGGKIEKESLKVYTQNLD